MSIFKDTFRKFVRDQLSIREEIIDIGNIHQEDFDSGGSIDAGGGISFSFGGSLFSNERKNRLKNHTIKTQTGENINLTAGAFYNYTLNKQCVIRMTSMVDYVEDVNLDIGDLRGKEGFQKIRGATLSRNFILEGGILSDYARNLNGETKIRRVDQPRQAFPKPGLTTNLGYGDFAIGADADEDGFGIVPMPGIISANVRTKSAYGSLREARVEFTCHNRRQLEVLEMLYMRPGYTVLLEWGWCPYINNTGKLVTDFETLENVTAGKIYTNDITQTDIYQNINKLKAVSGGNYDGVLGFIKNFGFKARPDGGYDCFTELISMGEIIESLKIPNILKGYEIKPKGYTSKPDIAVNNVINPRYNPLYGLVKDIYLYSSFINLEETALHGNPNSNSNIELEQLATELYQPESADEATKENSGILDQAAKADGEDYNNREQAVKTYLRKNLRATATSVRDALERGIGSGLTDHIIPRGKEVVTKDKRTYGDKTGNTGNNFSTTHPFEYEKYANQGYIRWDALCHLINKFIVPKDDYKSPVVNIVCDRIYDFPTHGRLDPLLYNRTTHVSDIGNRGFHEDSHFDFSCDANVCILPHQVLNDENGFKSAFGYLPRINFIDPTFIQEAYLYGKTIKYDNKDATRVMSTTDRVFPVKETDNLRIGSILLNIDMLVDIVEANKSNEDYTIGNFIKDIWKRVNNACPNHNFVLTDDKESNVVYVIDLVTDKKVFPKDLHEFIPFSNKNILRDFDLQTSVPSALSATIAIQAQDPRSIQDIDGVTFAAFNRSIKNRLFSKDTTSDWAKIAANVDNKTEEILQELHELEDMLQKFQRDFFKNIKETSNKRTPTVENNVTGVLKQYQLDWQYLLESIKNNGSIASVIPLNFNATLDGISGMVIGNMFKIKKDRLPKAYVKANVGFILFSEEQNITAGQDWVTTIGGKMVLLDSYGNNSYSYSLNSKKGPDRSKGKVKYQTAGNEELFTNTTGHHSNSDPVIKTQLDSQDDLAKVNEDNLLAKELAKAESSPKTLTDDEVTGLENYINKPALVENYKGFNIYKTATDQYYTIPEVIVDGEVEVAEDYTEYLIENVKEYIDESLL